MLDIKRIREDFDYMKERVEFRGKGDFGIGEIPVEQRIDDADVRVDDVVVSGRKAFFGQNGLGLNAAHAGSSLGWKMLACLTLSKVLSGFGFGHDLRVNVGRISGTHSVQSRRTGNRTFGKSSCGMSPA